MHIGVRYLAQLKLAAGVAAESIDLAHAATVTDLVAAVANRPGALRELLLDANGCLHPTVLVFVGDTQADPGATTPLRDGDIVTLLSPIAGG